MIENNCSSPPSGPVWAKADSRNRRDGRFVERIGYYNPVAAASEQGLVINAERLAYWQGQGARLSPTAARLTKQATAKQAA